MRLLGSSIAVPLVFSVYVSGEHGYLCSDAEGNTNTTYDQALVEKSVTDACLPASEPTADQLAANIEAKKYPQVWVDSEDYGFNETVLFWKYEENSTDTQEELEVLVFTNKACNILGLLQKSGDEYTICQSVNEEDIKKTSADISSKKPQPGIFSERNYFFDPFPGQGDTPETAISIPQYFAGDFDENGNAIHFEYTPPVPENHKGPPPPTYSTRKTRGVLNYFIRSKKPAAQQGPAGGQSSRSSRGRYKEPDGSALTNAMNMFPPPPGEVKVVDDYDPHTYIDENGNFLGL